MQEIRKQVDACYEELKKVFDPTTFVLRTDTVRIQEEINALQRQCKHHFVNGKCEYCDLLECEK